MALVTGHLVQKVWLSLKVRLTLVLLVVITHQTIINWRKFKKMGDHHPRLRAHPHLPPLPSHHLSHSPRH